MSTSPETLIFLDRMLTERFFAVEKDFYLRYDSIGISSSSYAIFKLKSN
jgi:hypothetical protein